MQANNSFLLIASKSTKIEYDKLLPPLAPYTNSWTMAYYLQPPKLEVLVDLHLSSQNLNYQEFDKQWVYINFDNISPYLLLLNLKYPYLLK